MKIIKDLRAFLLSIFFLLSLAGCAAKTITAVAGQSVNPSIESPAAATLPLSPEPTAQPKTVVLDPGHEASADTGTEPIGPGAAASKQKVSSGTQGKYTGVPEYKLNLTVSFKLKTELERRGYIVVMTRTKNDVALSNAQRAQISNEAGADAFIRIHANGSDDSSVSGVTTLCMTAQNPYNSGLYEQSRQLSADVLQSLASKTGARNLGITETDSMTGINWSQAPVTIVEIGFMTNKEEDILMEEEDYQAKIVYGIADGIDLYFKGEK
jgi:N-acetylmuramoyl-L-alanine amidase